MRISVMKTDKGYRANAHLHRVKLDGQLLTHAITADEEEGLVIQYVVDEKGKFVRDRGGQEFKTEERRGKVEVILPLSLVHGVRTPQ